MATLTQNDDPKKCSTCKACGLYLNQNPAFDHRTEADVFWVGLSAVQFDEHDERIPLSARTRSGGLIEQAEQQIGSLYSFYRTNVVKCLPLQAGKIRYPAEHEMSKCYPNLQQEVNKLKPSITFLLGKQVASFVLKQYGIKTFRLADDYRFDTFYFDNTYYVPVQHPSYMLVYKRKYIDDYLQGIASLVTGLIKKQQTA